MSELYVVLAGVALIAIILFTIWGVTPEYDKCYSRMEYEGHAAMGCCGGLVGGTSATEYLSEQCIECPYLVLTDTRKEKEDGKNNRNI